MTDIHLYKTNPRHNDRQTKKAIKLGKIKPIVFKNTYPKSVGTLMDKGGSLNVEITFNYDNLKDVPLAPPPIYLNYEVDESGIKFKVTE